MARKARNLVAMLAALSVFGACADDGAGDEVAIKRSGEVEIIGISGKRLSDGARYRVPLDSERIVALGAHAREAMVIVNRSLVPVRIERFELAPEAGAAGPWRLLAPTRAREVPLGAVGVVLDPERRLDFDVGLSPRVEGLQRATMIISWRSGGRAETRRITLEAWAVGAPTTTGPGPPTD